MPTTQKKRKTVRKTVPSRTKTAGAKAPAEASAPITATGSPETFRVRVRMYRQGLGDCFLLTFPRKGKEPFQMLIDCGALARDKKFMTRIVEHIRDTVKAGRSDSKARLDLVVATHEHRDHLSGFNQARSVFNDEFDFGAVWLGWTENLTKPEILEIKKTKRKAADKIRAALSSPFGGTLALQGVRELMSFSQDDDTTGAGKIAEALEYLKLRGREAGKIHYCEPGEAPLELDGVEDVRVYVLGPPRDPILLKTSAVTEQMKKDDVVYRLMSTGEAGMDALGAAVSTTGLDPGRDRERYYPFSNEHRIVRKATQGGKPNPYFDEIREFLSGTYDAPGQQWRQIEEDWLSAFGQLALDLDNDTNNTSLVLAFEFVKTEEVLLFVGDAQVGNWQSWADVRFTVPGREVPLRAWDLLRRTVFYKVGHHCSHNATLRKGGLELMNRDDLVAFIPLDQETARNQGTKGWEMPAPALFKALKSRTAERVVISDVREELTAKAKAASILSTETYVDYFLA